MRFQDRTSIWQHIKPLLPIGTSVERPRQYLLEGPTSKKAVIQIFGRGNSGPSVILKASPSNGEGGQALAAEFRVLTILRSRMSKDQELRFSAPVPIECFGEAGWSYTVETAAPGRPLTELIFLRSRRGRLDFLRNELSQCVEIAAKVPDVLKGSVASREVDPEWYKIPSGMSLGSEIEQTLAVEANRWSHEDLCAHGDFTIGNVFWQSGVKKASVIDWEHPIRGVPRLYDAFILLLSSLPALALEYREIPSADDRLERQFEAAFFGTGAWATVTHEVLQHVGGSSSGAASDLWRQLLLSLLIRTNYFLWREASLGRQYSRLLKFAAEHEHRFVCGAPATA